MSLDYDLTVIAPCYNESANVVELTERLCSVFTKRKMHGEICLVDDASTDNTGALTDELVVKCPNVCAMHHPVNKGIVSSWKTGLAVARGSFVCLIDSDLQNLPEDVWRLYDEIKFSHADLVQGWRNHIGRPKGGLGRQIASRGLNILLNLLFGMKSRDNKSGFIICRREVLNDILNFRYHYRFPQTFIGVAAKYKGYSIREIETLFQDRQLGKSFIKFPLKISFLTLFDVLKGLFEFRFFDFKDNTLCNFLKVNHPTKKDPPLPMWRTWLYKTYIALFPLHHWMISYGAYEYYKNLKKSQWLSLKKIREYQEIKLHQLIIHAYHHVPFYRDCFEQRGLTPEDIKTIADLQKLPIIDKKNVRENLYLGIMSDNHDKNQIQKVQTSGSTGEPFVTYAEKKQLEMRWAATQRSLEWTGYQFGDRQVRLWHKYLGMKPLEVIKEIIDAKLSRRRFIPVYEITDENLGAYVKQIMKYKPAILDGYAESFNLIARFLKRNSYFGHTPKGIMSSAQSLPEESRRIIEDTFHCGVFDKYGAREFAGGLAYQCSERKGYHVVAECAIIEIIKDGRPAQPGEVGEVIVTELNNYAMPLIRYKVGDLAVAVSENQECACGRGLPLIGEIQGRTQAIVIGTHNQFIPGTFFNRVFFKHDLAIRQYQIVQEKFGEITIKIIKGNLFSDEVLREIFKDIKTHLGDDLQIKVEYVKEIPLVRTGKRQHCISYLDPLVVVKKESNIL